MEWGILIPILGILMGPVMYLIYLKEKKIDRSHKLEDAGAAQAELRIAELEQRVRVLERIITDGGMQTAAQIEALREAPQRLDGLTVREKVQ
jgi:TolA-binding protein